jgi:mono/diheme cytochrome c family protein
MTKKAALAFLFFTFFLMILLQFNCSSNEEKQAMTNEEMVANGKYLVNYGGCNHCHSPKVFTQMGPMLDITRLLSGYPADGKLSMIDTSVTNTKWVYARIDLTAWAGPWGVSFAVNLTPDGPTGIGNWTDEIFIKSLRTGKHMGFGRNILPPMPWQDIGNLKDEDLKSIFAYLKSLPPINNQVPDPIPPNMIAQMVNKKK